MNRLATVTDPNGTTSYSYDAVSNKISVDTPNGVIESYSYDALNRVLTAINKKGTVVFSSFANVHDAAGMITKKTFSDGSWTTYSYDSLNQLLRETKQTSTAIIYDLVYTYNAARNRLTQTKNTTLGKFWSTDSSSMPPQVLTSMNSAGFGSTANPAQSLKLVRNYSYDKANRLTQWSYAVKVGLSTFPIETNTYTYDKNGNRITKQKVRTGQSNTPQKTIYTYDFENRLTQLQYSNIPGMVGSQTDKFSYSDQGLRTESVLNNVVTKYLYDGTNVLVERDVSNVPTKTYTRGLDQAGGIGGLISQNTETPAVEVSFYNYDDLASVTNLTTKLGAIAGSYNYDAFGNLLTIQGTSDTNRFLFSSKEYDFRSGLSYFGARYYDPEVGRWLTPDPLGFGDGLNLYTYVNNNPMNLIDPYGFMGERISDSLDNFLNELDTFSTALMMNPAADGLPQFPLDQGIGLLGMSTGKGIRALSQFQWHHIYPKYIGGDAKGPVVRLAKSYHQQITNAFRSAFPYIKETYQKSFGDPAFQQKVKDVMVEIYKRFPLP